MESTAFIDFLRNSKCIPTVVLDYSGVIFNDRFFTLAIVNDVFRQFSIPPIDTIGFRREFRLPFYSIFVERGIPKKTAQDAAIRAYHSSYPSYRQEIVPFSDTVSCILALRSAGIRLAIVSQTPRPELEDQLRRFDLLPYFQSVIAYKEARMEKPHPSPLQETAECLGTKPQEMLYIGDMFEDAECARRAGVNSVVVDRACGSYHTREMLLKARPDYIIPDLRSLQDLVMRGTELIA